MYVITNGKVYIGAGLSNSPTTVNALSKAIMFKDRQRAVNYKENLKNTLKRFSWEVIQVGDGKDDNNDETSDYAPTQLEENNFNISDFFNSAIKTFSQLKQYATNMGYLEQEYNKKIKDVRHYKRDIRTKLNAIQLQRLEQFEILLERERYECKSNRMIAEIFLTDLSRMENVNYIEVVKNVKESEYKPEIFTYEFLDEIVGKKRVWYVDSKL